MHLGETEPHLIISFESGRTFFLNGHHNKYESWELGVWFPEKDEDFLVVACPGDNLSIWAPDNFK